MEESLSGGEAERRRRRWWWLRGAGRFLHTEWVWAVARCRSEEVCSEGVGSEEVGSEEVCSEGVGSEEVGSEEVCSGRGTMGCSSSAVLLLRSVGGADCGHICSRQDRLSLDAAIPVLEGYIHTDAPLTIIVMVTSSRHPTVSPALDYKGCACACVGRSG